MSRGPGIRDHGHIVFCDSEGHLGFMNWPLTGDPADSLLERILPLASAGMPAARPTPVLFGADARYIMVACPRSDVVVQLEVQLCTCSLALRLHSSSDKPC